jgi:hypothetical protein
MQPQVQVEIPDPTQPQGAAARYGEPARRELASIAHSPELYVTHRSHVITHGQVDMAAPTFYSLRDAGARVLLLLGHGIDRDQLQRYMAGRVEVRGIVRSLRPKEYLLGVDLDLIEDPELPVLPAPSLGLPRVSITVLALTDANGAGASEGTAGELTISDLAADPARYSGAKVRVVGRFRGRNLYGDLPSGTQRDPSDWVLLDGAAAVWVCGKPPRGKGFSLDPGYKADTVRWLEVHGRIEVAQGIVYVRASKVALATGPAKADQDSTP